MEGRLDVSGCSEYLLGSDIGTTLTKTVLVDMAGKEIAAATSEYGVLHPRPLWAEQWPDVWLDAFVASVREVVGKAAIHPEQIVGIGVSGLYGGSGIPVDKTMTPIRPCIIWMDRRAEEEVNWVRSHLDVEKLFKITGNGVDSYHGFTKMLWMKRHEPDAWKRVYRFVTPNGYVIHHLTGELAIDQSSAGNIGGVFDLSARTWSKASCEWLGIPTAKLPERIVESSDIVGRITPSSAKLTGLAAGTPVIAGGIDAAVATLSAGAFDPGNHVAMIGTSMCWGVVHDGESVSPNLVSMPYVAYPTSKVYTFGGAATAGALPRWFRDEFGQAEAMDAEAGGASAYQLLDAAASKVSPGADRLVVLPYFMGERSPIWDSGARGTILGLTLSHSRAHVYRALLEGVAFALRHNIEAGVDMGFELDDTCVLVGGAANSPVWAQILSDVTGYKLIAVRGSEAALGAALLAGIGTGCVDSFEAIRGWLVHGETIHPDSATKGIYDRLFHIYKQTYRNLKSTMHELSGDDR